MHTLSLPATLVYAGANNHDIVDDREAALATYPGSVPVLDSTVYQHCSLIHHDFLLVKLPGIGNLFLVEEVPC
jgi:hypothetical protein